MSRFSDFAVSDHGSVWLFAALTETACTHAEEMFPDITPRHGVGLRGRASLRPGDRGRVARRRFCGHARRSSGRASTEGRMIPRTKWHPSITDERIADACDRQLTTLDNPGLCLACGNEQEGCEPDARKYVCESCGAAPRLRLRGVGHGLLHERGEDTMKADKSLWDGIKENAGPIAVYVLTVCLIFVSAFNSIRASLH